MSRPRIVGVVRQPGGNAIGGVLTDGKAKLPFVRLASPKDEVVAGREAKKVLGKGTWLPAQRLHNCFKAPQTYTVSDGLTTRKLTIIEFNFDDHVEYIVVSQAAKRGIGYVERFRHEDSLVGAFYCQYRMDPFIVEHCRCSDEFMNPTYDVLTECAAEARRAFAEDTYMRSWGIEEIMFQAVVQWYPGKDSTGASRS